MIPRDLDWLSAVVAYQPESWDPDFFAGYPLPEDYPSPAETGPPVPREALELVPNARALEERDHSLAENQPDRPVTSLEEALRHFRVLDRHYQPGTLFWDRVFLTGRTRSALDIYYRVVRECLAWEAEYGFLFYLVYATDEVRDYVIEGEVYRAGNFELSLPWSVVQSGTAPRVLRNFGRELDTDAVHPDDVPSSVPGVLRLGIHGAPSSNPWLLDRTHDFLADMASRWGWYVALDFGANDLYAFFAACVDREKVSVDMSRLHPLAVTQREMTILSRVVDENQDEGERPVELLEQLELALETEISAPLCWEE